MSRLCIPFAKTALSVALATVLMPSQVLAQQTDVEIEQTEQATDSTDAEVILVKGLRSSLMKAQDIKMNSDSIVDAIVAEDIGKLPDLTAAESIARIAGIQVNRRSDEARDILIRGLPNVTTTFNGRELFTAELRQVQLQDFPSQALAGIEVYKSGTADLLEPGLAGLVNVRSRRPFDFDGEKISGTLRYAYNDQNEKSAPTGSILYSNRWTTALGEIGFLANATYTQSEYHNGVRYNDTWFRNANRFGSITPEQFSEGEFLIPNRVGIYQDLGKRTRPSWNMAAQWRPSDQLEVYADAIYQGFRGEGQADSFWFHLVDWDRYPTQFGDPTLTNVVMVEGTDDGQAASLTKSGGLPAMAYRSTNKGATDTYQFAVGAKWQNGPLKIETDLAYTDSTYEKEEWSFDTSTREDWLVNVDFFGEEGGVTFDAPNANVHDLDAYNFRGYFESHYKVGGSGVQWKTDLTYTFDDGILNKIQAGVRFTDRDATRDSGNRLAGVLYLNKPLSSLDFLEYEQTFNPFRSDKQGFTTYLAPTRDSIINNHEKLSQVAYEYATELGNSDPARFGWALGEAEKFLTPKVAYDPASYFEAKEQTYAAYLQAKFMFDIGDMPVDIVAGTRVTRSETDVTGTSRLYDLDGNRTLESTTVDDGYTDVLPNVSVAINLTDDVKLRSSYTKTRTRVDFAALNPSTDIRPRNKANDNPNGEDVPEHDATASSGNPYLKPLTSNNYDISLEYYFSDSGYVSGATFYRDLFGFTRNFPRHVEDADYGTVLLSKPENSGQGEIWGWEINAQTFMDYDFMPEALHAFGISANVTRLEGKERYPAELDTSDSGTYGPIPGLSKYTYNTAVFYEKDGFSARLSYNKRDTWVNWFRNTIGAEGFTGNKTKARDRLDLSASYEINDNFTVYADISNIMANPFHNYVQHNDNIAYTQDIRDEGRYYGVGLKFSF
ncbi:TonB-dependent receptor [Catenovulum agarivorans]|uniref:TonB-dependent receptor n=1 Tax=Catenovulum agarivorans TaxID=1172192 RepID=UPI0003049552|nr:TonB-dependent receptor [Catenovulum agarivorans]